MIPTREAMALWIFARLPRFDGLARTIARCPGGVTLMFAEQDDGSYEVTKMQGGKILDRRKLHHLPEHIHDHLDRRRQPHDRASKVRA